MSTAEQLLGDLARSPEHHLEALSGREAAEVLELEPELPFLRRVLGIQLEYGHAATCSVYQDER
jgi:hypothetical protein